MDPVQMDEWQKEYKNVRHEFEKSNHRQLGYFDPFKELQQTLSLQEFKACSALSCAAPIQKKTFFNKDCNKRDGLNSFCKECSNGSGKLAAVAAGIKRKHENMKLNESLTSGFDRGAVEDKAVKWATTWLCTKFHTEGIEINVLPEFRNADFAFRFAGWPHDLHFPVQLKSDCEVHVDGKPKPDNSFNFRHGGGSAQFQKCTGYSGMIVFFVKTRVNAEGASSHTLWWCLGDKVTKTQVNEGSSHGEMQNNGYRKTIGELSVGSLSVAPQCLDSFPQLLLDTVNTHLHLRRTWKELWLDVRSVAQRKEVAGMLALDQISRVEFPRGNQTSIDCTFQSKTTQVKTPNARNGRALTRHEVGGRALPYSESDGIEQLVEPLVVKSDNVFYLLYATQTLEALLQHGIFSSATNPGQMSITIPLGKYSEWLTGKRSNESRRQTNWLVDTEYGWQQPVKLVPNDWLTTDMLNEVAHVAARPDLSPVES